VIYLSLHAAEHPGALIPITNNTAEGVLIMSVGLKIVCNLGFVIWNFPEGDKEDNDE
jgi:hypothetical protein